MPLKNLVSHHRSVADLCGVVDILCDMERHKTSETVPWHFIITAVQMYCATADTAAVLIDSLMSNAHLKEICFTPCVVPSDCISTTKGQQCCTCRIFGKSSP